MKNSDAQLAISECMSELKKIGSTIKGVGATNDLVPFLTRYSVIKSCGTIELCFKTLLSDFHGNQSQQIKNYIDSEIRNSSMNPNINNINRTLNKFDSSWNKDFNAKLGRLPSKVKSSLKSLNSARNTFAHGGNPTCTFDDVKGYFTDSVRIIRIIDSVLK